MSESPPKVEVGDVLAGKYRVERILGSGGMGQVVRAVHVDIDRVVAVKLLHGLVSEDAISRFRREARAAAKLEGEFVCKTFDFGTTADGEPFLVMEHLEGYSLEDFVAKKALTVERAVDFVIMAAAGLAEAHLAGVVHRDVKPANLFVTRRLDGSYVVKVVDFGISKEAQGGVSITQSSHALGTPLYMSPEQIRSSKTVDGRADVWSLGVVLYELLTGKLPFEGDGVNGVLASILETVPASPAELRPGLPAGLVALVLRCLEKNASLRVGSMRELARDLAPYGSPEGRLIGEKTMRLGSHASAPPPSSGRAATESAETQAALPVASASAAKDSPESELVAQRTATGMSMRTPGARRTKASRTWLVVAVASLGVGVGAALWLSGRKGDERSAVVVVASAASPPVAPQGAQGSVAVQVTPGSAPPAASPPAASTLPSSSAPPSAHPTARVRVGPRPPPTADPSLF